MTNISYSIISSLVLISSILVLGILEVLRWGLLSEFRLFKGGDNIIAGNTAERIEIKRYLSRLCKSTTQLGITKKTFRKLSNQTLIVVRDNFPPQKGLDYSYTKKTESDNYICFVSRENGNHARLCGREFMLNVVLDNFDVTKLMSIEERERWCKEAGVL